MVLIIMNAFVAELMGFQRIVPNTYYNGKSAPKYFELLELPEMASVSYEASLQHVTNGVNVSILYAQRHTTSDNELRSFKKDLVGTIKFFTDKKQNKIYVEIPQYYTLCIRTLVGSNELITIAKGNNLSDVSGLNEITSTIV